MLVPCSCERSFRGARLKKRAALERAATSDIDPDTAKAAYELMAKKERPHRPLTEIDAAIDKLNEQIAAMKIELIDPESDRDYLAAKKELESLYQERVAAQDANLGNNS